MTGRFVAWIQRTHPLKGLFAIWGLIAAWTVLCGAMGLLMVGCSDSPSPQQLRATIARPDNPLLPMLHPSLADITNHHTPCRSYPDGRPRIETVSYPVAWIDDVASEEVTRLDRDGFLAGGRNIASHWFGDDLFLLGKYGVPKGKTAVLEYRAGDASVYAVGYLPGELDISPPPAAVVAVPVPTDAEVRAEMDQLGLSPPYPEYGKEEQVIKAEIQLRDGRRVRIRLFVEETDQ